MWVVFTTFLTICFVNGELYPCGHGSTDQQLCICEESSQTTNRSGLIAHCSANSWKTIPEGLPIDIQVMNLSRNVLNNTESICVQYPRLRVIDLSDNQLQNLGQLLSDCDKAQTINLIGNVIHAIDKSSFKSTPFLTSLYLEVVKVDTHAFENLENLGLLELIYHSSELDASLFQGMMKLKTLILTLMEAKYFEIELSRIATLRELRIKGRKITKMNTDFLSALVKLEVLSLDFSHLPSLDLSFKPQIQRMKDLSIINVRELLSLSGAVSLATLHLEGVNIWPENIFTGLRYLKTLELVNCSILAVKPSWFSTLISLERLSLRANLLKVLDGKSFSGLQSLKHLDLSKNKIDEISVTAFVPFKDNLVSLMLQENALHIIKKQLREMRNLEILDLSYSNISRILPGAFDGATKLTTIDLQHNYLFELDNALFTDVHSLKKLYLSDNLLSSFPEEIVLPSLFNLKLDGNKITHLDPYIICNMTSLEHLDLERNPVHCDCKVMNHIYGCFVLKPIEIIGRCETPTEFSKTNISKVYVRKSKRSANISNSSPTVPLNNTSTLDSGVIEKSITTKNLLQPSQSVTTAPSTIDNNREPQRSFLTTTVHSTEDNKEYPQSSQLFTTTQLTENNINDEDSQSQMLLATTQSSAEAKDQSTTPVKSTGDYNNKHPQSSQLFTTTQLTENNINDEDSQSQMLLATTQSSAEAKDQSTTRVQSTGDYNNKHQQSSQLFTTTQLTENNINDEDSQSQMLLATTQSSAEDKDQSTTPVQSTGDYNKHPQSSQLFTTTQLTENNINDEDSQSQMLLATTQSSAEDKDQSTTPVQSTGDYNNEHSQSLLTMTPQSAVVLEMNVSKNINEEMKSFGSDSLQSYGQKRNNSDSEDGVLNESRNVGQNVGFKMNKTSLIGDTFQSDKDDSAHLESGGKISLNSTAWDKNKQLNGSSNSTINDKDLLKLSSENNSIGNETAEKSLTLLENQEGNKEDKGSSGTIAVLVVMSILVVGSVSLGTYIYFKSRQDYFCFTPQHQSLQQENEDIQIHHFQPLSGSHSA